MLMILVIVTLSCVSSSYSTPDQVQITCQGGKTTKVLYRYPVIQPTLGPATLAPLEYENEDSSIYGKLRQDIKIMGSGNCYELFIRFRGVMTEGWHEWNIKKDSYFNINTGVLSNPGFGTLIFQNRTDSLCQNIIMSREIRYNKARPSYCRHFITYEDDPTEYPNNEDKYGKQQKACMYYIGRYTHNPFSSWLAQKALKNRNQNETLCELKIESNSIRVNWGLIKTFNCQKKNIELIEIQLVHKNRKMKKETLELFTDETLLVENESHLSCYPWNVHLKIKMKFETFNEKCKWYAPHFTNCFTMEKRSEQFRQYIKPTTFVPQNLGLELVNTTVVKLYKKDGTSDIDCLEAELTVLFVTPQKKKQSKILNADHTVDIGDILEPCKEYVIDLKVRSVFGNLAANTTLQLFPVLDKPEFINSSIIFPLAASRFSPCPNIRVRMECLEGETKNNLTSVFDFAGLYLDIENITQYKGCRAKAYIVQDGLMNLRSWTEWFSIDGSEFSNTSTIVSATTSVLAIVVIVSALAIIMMRRRNQWIPHLVIKKTDKVLPAHMVFTNSDSLSNELDTAALLQEGVMEEFEKLEEFVKQKIDPGESCEEGLKNLLRNRYKDILPYDSNLVTLSTPTGSPKSSYINASWVNFDDFSQSILAVQAPKVNMVSGFWQIVLDNKVSVIVMITKLVENGLVKAHQYWPDEDNATLELENDIQVIFESEETDKGLDRRTFVVSNKATEQTVEQVHCQNWPDLQAPRDTSVLLDMYEMVDTLIMESPGTMMVHCSAGVGRTGAFIGLYKLIKDVNNAVPEVDPFATVVEMRQARRKMVQKPVQYHYVIKCLADYVRGEVSQYA